MLLEGRSEAWAGTVQGFRHPSSFKLPVIMRGWVEKGLFWSERFREGVWKDGGRLGTYRAQYHASPCLSCRYSRKTLLSFRLLRVAGCKRAFFLVGDIPRERRLLEGWWKLWESLRMRYRGNLRSLKLRMIMR